MDEINDLRSVLKERRISINGRSRRNSPAKRIQTAEPPELTDMDFKLPHDVVIACAKRIQTAEPPELTDMDIKLPHDVVSACTKRDEPPSRRS